MHAPRAHHAVGRRHAIENFTVCRLQIARDAVRQQTTNGTSKKCSNCRLSCANIYRPSFRSQLRGWQWDPPLPRAPPREMAHHADGPGGRRGVHLLGLDVPHNRSADGLTFFVLVIAQEPSGRLRTSISRPHRNRFQWCSAWSLKNGGLAPLSPSNLRSSPRVWYCLLLLTVLIKTTLESVIFSLLHQSVKIFFRCAGTRVCTHSAKLLPCCLLMGARVSWMSFSQVW